MRPEIGLGDAVRVSAILGLDPAIALRLLGLSAPEPAVPPPPFAPPPPDQPFSARPPTPAPPAPSDRSHPAPSPLIEPPRPQRPQPPLIQAHSPGVPRFTGPPVPLPPVAEVMPAPAATGVLTDPSLLPPARQRAILAALCRTSGPGEIDVPEVVRRLARAEPLTRLPTTLVPTMRRGVQVLVDLGPGMQPFLDDQRQVLHALHRLIGREGLEVLRFAGTPLDEPGAGPGPVWTWRPYRPPIDDRRVLVLSDLGGGPGHRDRGAVQDRWLRFAALFRHGERPLVALVPVPAERLPAGLRAGLPMVTWDR
ncbi:MAG TPA: hypothetical protein VFG35_28060, partial [Actinoplanes sp.]|nr:hypothetical protein [Actinoplanes sp.]